MQSKASDQVPPGTDEGSLSQNSKRRRTSERSTRATQELEPTKTPPMGRRTLTTSSPQRGSSRDMTPPESAGGIKYTRTGRVSKATKGQRVHDCKECGKTYTRAEHLRRHQQNHKPGAFPCDVPGCGRSFYREDLLIRHKARHNDPNNPPSRPASPSPSSQGSVPVERIPSISRTPTTIAQTPGLSHTETERDGFEQPQTSDRIPDARDSIRQKLPVRNTLHGRVALPVSAGVPISGIDIGDISAWPWGPPSPYSPSRYGSPSNGDYHPYGGGPYFQPQFPRERQSSDASFFSYNPYPSTSRSPNSAGSSNIDLHLPWAHSSHDPTFEHFGTSFGTDNSFQKGFDPYNGHMAEQQFHLGAFDPQRPLAPEYRDCMEHDDLLVPAPSPHGSTIDLGLDELNYTNDQRYLGAYWRWIHPLYPVVHRPSFNLPNASPLLRAAMLALGAHALPETADKRNARIIHERCVKRTLNSSHSYRTCDIQALVLVEVYSIFKSRRPPLQLSKIFQDAYVILANDILAVSGEISAGSLVDSNTAYMDEATLSIEVKCRQRLLLACYVLDQQHATLFGRQRTNCCSGAGMDLPFPENQSSWDAVHSRQADRTRSSRVWEAMDSASLDEPGQHQYDMFQSMLMMSVLADSNEFDSTVYIPDVDKLLSKMDQSPRIKLAHHTFMLCKYTPMRDLLGVAGESWVMAEKLSNQAEYTAAQMRTRQWAKGARDSVNEFNLEVSQLSVSSAMKHALEILELLHHHPVTGSLFQEWAMYLASIASWARAYVTTGKLEQGRRLSVANPAERRPSLRDLDQEIATLLMATASNDVSLEQAKTILLWTKARIETVDIPHNCGLTNGALDVLGKLTAKYSDDGWLG